MITFAKASVVDTPVIKKLLYITWSWAYKSILSQQAIDTVTAKWHAPELLSQQILHPQITFIVAKDRQNIIGTCNTSRIKNPAKVNIQRLHVLPAYQRQGIGTKLIEEVMKYYPQACTIDLEVECNNQPAIAFYKKMGFKKAGEKVFEVEGVTIPSFIMAKNIK